MLNSPEGAALLERISRIPIVNTLQFQWDVFEPGRCRVTVPYDRKYDGVFESFHGGILMTVADSIACFAIMTRTGPDQRMATTDMNIRFLAACRTDLVADARVVKLGRSLVPVAVDLFDTHGTLVAIAQVTYMRLS